MRGPGLRPTGWAPPPAGCGDVAGLPRRSTRPPRATTAAWPPGPHAARRWPLATVSAATTRAAPGTARPSHEAYPAGARGRPAGRGGDPRGDAERPRHGPRLAATPGEPRGPGARRSRVAGPLPPAPGYRVLRHPPAAQRHVPGDGARGGPRGPRPDLRPDHRPARATRPGLPRHAAAGGERDPATGHPSVWWPKAGPLAAATMAALDPQRGQIAPCFTALHHNLRLTTVRATSAHAVMPPMGVALSTSLRLAFLRFTRGWGLSVPPRLRLLPIHLVDRRRLVEVCHPPPHHGPGGHQR